MQKETQASDPHFSDSVILFACFATELLVHLTQKQEPYL
jgi:hypothetical protein